LRFINYTIASFLLHLLLLGILALSRFETDSRVLVYYVDIVNPSEEEKVVLEHLEIPDVQGPAAPPKSASKNILDEAPPESMFGEGTDSTGYAGEVPPQQTADNLNGAGQVSPDKGGVLPEGSKSLSLKPKKFLFDKETIEKYSQRAPLGEKDLSFDAPEFHHRGYIKMLKDRIESIWKYPKEAARRGISGDLYIEFSIKRDGSLGEVRLIRTSGYKDLDKAAMKALKDGEPYWPLPDNWKGDDLSITGHFIYITGKFYVM